MKKAQSFLSQLNRSLWVGGLAFAADAGTLFLLTLSSFYKTHYLLAASLSFCVGLTLNYALSVLWVFPNRRFSNRWAEFALFALIGLVGLGVNALAIWFLTDIAMPALIPLKQPRILAGKVLATIATFAWNFGIRRFAVFGAGPSQESK
jgi:putative flippase GtrA